MQHIKEENAYKGQNSVNIYQFYMMNIIFIQQEVL